MRIPLVKIATIAALCLVSAIAYAQEADTVPVTEETQKGVHPWNQEENKNPVPFFSNWSVFLDLGFNSFDGDFNSEMKHPVSFPAVGLGVEYTFTPYIGIGLNYMFDKYRVTGIENKSADVLLDGMVHKVGLYLPVDLVSCFAPRAEHRLFNIQLLAGGGLAWYTSSVYYPQADRGNTLKVEPQSMNGEYKFLPYMNVGLNFEFNIGRSIGLGVKGTYNFFTRDDMDGRYGGASVNNDGIFDIALTLRYKINAHQRSHERNVTSGAQEEQLASIAAGNPVASSVNPEDVAREIMDKGLIKPIKDTVFVVQKDTILLTTNTNDRFFVYFETGNSTLTDQALIAIQQAAAQLLSDENTYALIIGHCDNTGSDHLNNALSQDRAKAVEQELTAEYGINPDRLLAYGEGKIIGKRSKASYTPNRRVEVLLLTEEEFIQRKQELRAEQEANAQSDIRQNKSNTGNATGVLDTIVVTQGTTLARLAGKYYNNRADLWTYIFEANRNVLSNPDFLPEGITLIIPALSEEQLRASKRLAAIY